MLGSKKYKKPQQSEQQKKTKGNIRDSDGADARAQR